MASTAESVASFQERFGGDVLLPGDGAYEHARRLWNADIDREPALIARCRTSEHVAEAVALAGREGLELTVRGGGHNFGGLAICDDGLMIDLSRMNAVAVKQAARRVRCGGGATWADVDAATQVHGLAVTGGVISHTGVGGLTLGGGMGWLTRRAGLSCDNLVSAEVVLADGSIVTASAGEHPDLFWALRGGGGNFGVVTAFELALHEVGPEAQLGFFFWGVDQGAEALRFCREYIAGLPDDAGVLLAGLSAPPEPFVPDEHQLQDGFALLVATWGSAAEHAELVRPVREQMPGLFDLVTPIAYTHLQTLFDEGNEWGSYAYEKGLYLDDLSDAVIDVLVEHLPRKISPLSFVPAFGLGGAFARVGDDDTAFGGSRATRYAISIAAICADPQLLEADRRWVRGLWEALRPHTGKPAGYVNFMSEIDEDRVRSAYGAAKYDRLAAIKADFDPDNLFHHNANILPAS